MRFIKRSPSLLGWLLFYVFTQLLASLLAWYVASFAVKYDTGPFAILTVSTAIVAYLIFSFFLFLISIRMIVLPFYQNGKVKSVEAAQFTFARQAKKWFDYSWEFILFCFPLLCQFTDSSAEEAFRFVWQLVASYLAFRLVVHPWMMEITGSDQEDNEKQIVTA